MDVVNLRDYENLSPFEIKDELIRLARMSDRASTQTLLNAGRGNPNWVATRAREVFFLLGQFAIAESTRVMALPAGIGGMPRAPGISDRLDAWLIRDNYRAFVQANANGSQAVDSAGHGRTRVCCSRCIPGCRQRNVDLDQCCPAS
jgi:hypothetical protein